VVSERAPDIDAFSLNRLLLSRDAEAAQAAISYQDAGPAINETARLVRELGYELIFDSLPLCVFEGDNAEWIRAQVAARASGRESEERYLYLDPFVTAGKRPPSILEQRRALPDPCLSCELISACRRVEGWYVRRFGYAGLHPVRGSNAPGEPRTLAGA
jgi:hypothetical protein